MLPLAAIRQGQYLPTLLFMVVLLLVIFIGYIMSVVFLRLDMIKIMQIITVVVVGGDVAKP